MANRKFSTIPSFRDLESMSFSELKKEFTALRDIFQKRVKRMAGAGIKKAEPYINGPAAIPTLSGLKEKPYIRNADPSVFQAAVLRETENLVNLLGPGIGVTETGSFSISGLRKARTHEESFVAKSLQKAGYGHISKSTIRNFGRFMDAMREEYGKKNPQSEEQAEFFESLKYNAKRKATKSLMDAWKEFAKNGYKPNESNADLFRT